MALQLSEDRISLTERRNEIIEGLRALPSQIKRVLEEDKQLQTLSTTVLAHSKSLLLMGRGYQYDRFPAISLLNLTGPQICYMLRRRSED